MDTITKNQEFLYDTYRFGSFPYREKIKHNEPLLYEFLSLVKPNNSLYDVGAGSGFWLNTYLNFGISKEQITVIDLSPSNINEIKNDGFNAHCDNILNLKLKENISDFTISLGVIHHTTNPLKAFKELVRITQPSGYIYLSVYNKWNPYFYIVHKATFPIRYIYWKWTKKIATLVYLPFKIFTQIVSLFILRQFIDDKTIKAIFMDQVITERAHLFCKNMIKTYAGECNCEVIDIKYSRYHLMLAAIIKVGS